MTRPSSHNKTVFDAYATDYDAALACGLSVSGEDKQYFARGRLAWLKTCLQARQETFRTAMDYGCGTGSSADFFFTILGIDRLFGTDTSQKSIEIARQLHGSARAQFCLFEQFHPAGQIDLAFCNGVFHHILPHERPAAVHYIYQALRPGGLFAFWENNPWNPGTRYVMSRIPFDRDAIMLPPPEARGLLQASGFEILRTDFLFIFPRLLSWCRALEPYLARLPLGTQYQILCRKPVSSSAVV